MSAQGWVLRADTSTAQDIQLVPYPIGHLDNAPLAALAAAPPIRCTFEVGLLSLNGGLHSPKNPKKPRFDSFDEWTSRIQ